MKEIFNKYYAGYSEMFINNISEITMGLLKSVSCNTTEIARAMSSENGKSFKTNDMAVYRFLGHDEFQIDDKLFRKHLNMLYDYLESTNRLKKSDKIQIHVDMTSNKDDFLMLCAAIRLGERDIPIYFTMRNYPKRKNAIDYRKMEEAFLRGLMHCLSNKYQYVIVADRGFGNQRIMNLCEELGFEYVIRIEPNMKIECGGRAGLTNEIIDRDGSYPVKVVNWNKEMNFYRHSENDSTWYLSSNINELDESSASYMYGKRFKIEKFFQDMKSSGFNIESSKIRKYARFKRMLYLSMLAYIFVLILGERVNHFMGSIKKNLPVFTSVFAAYFKWEKPLYDIDGIKYSPP